MADRRGKRRRVGLGTIGKKRMGIREEVNDMAEQEKKTKRKKMMMLMRYQKKKKMHNLKLRRSMQNRKEKENMIFDYHNIAEKDRYLIVDDDLVVTQILSRLPAKSLMRCKCVCKSWKSIIERDSHLIDLHHTNSQARPVLLIAKENGTRFYLADLQYDEDGDNVIGANLRTLRGLNESSYVVQHLGPVRGLLCLVDGLFAVQIYNVSTGQVVTPWIKSAVVTNMKHEGSPRCQFGYDPSTGKHKVVYVWHSSALGSYKEAPVCEVLTVGDTSWRIIDDVPPCKIHAGDTVSGNGSVYWLTHTGELPCRAHQTVDYSEFLVAFDIGDEKFRMIPIPKFTLLGSHPLYKGLTEIDGFPTVVRTRILKDRVLRCRRVKMWKFRDYSKEKGREEEDWTEVNVRIPDDVPGRRNFYHLIAGKNQMIVESYHSPGFEKKLMRNVHFASFYSYNLIKDTVCQFEIQGISSVPDDCATRCSTLVESLLAVAES